MLPACACCPDRQSVRSVLNPSTDQVRSSMLLRIILCDVPSEFRRGLSSTTESLSYTARANTGETVRNREIGADMRRNSALELTHYVGAVRETYTIAVSNMAAGSRTHPRSELLFR